MNSEWGDHKLKQGYSTCILSMYLNKTFHTFCKKHFLYEKRKHHQYRLIVTFVFS